jgi:hypothetical protein
MEDKMSALRMIFDKTIVHVIFSVIFFCLGIQLQYLYAQDAGLPVVIDDAGTASDIEYIGGDEADTADVAPMAGSDLEKLQTTENTYSFQPTYVPMEPIKNETLLEPKYEMKALETTVENRPAAYIYTEYNETMEVPLDDGRKVTLDSRNGDEDIVALDALSKDKTEDLTK